MIITSSPRRAAAVARALLAGTAAVPALVPMQVQAQAATYSVAPQSLQGGLLDLSRQSGLRLVAPAQVLAGKRTAGVSGSPSATAALQALLAGSGLRGSISNGTIVIAAPASTAAVVAPEGGVLLDEVVLSGQGETAYGAVDGIAAEASATATKTDTPIIETPQTVNVVPAAQVTETGAVSVPEALAYTPGVSQTYGYTQRTGDQVQMRGFDVYTTLRDGMSYQINTYDGQQEPYGLERIEVLKGASSVLYGNLRPGGVINTVSKLPPDEPLREVKLETGSHDRRQVAADVGGPLDKDGVWSFRLTGLYRDSNTFIDYLPDDRRYLGAALRWQPDDRTSLTLLGEYQKDHTMSFSAAVPAQGVVLPNVHGKIPRSRMLGEPGYDHYRLSRGSVGYLLEHEFSDALSFRQSLRYFAADQDNSAIYFDSLLDDQRTVARSGQDRDEHTWGVTMDNSLQWNLQQGDVSHTVLAGVDVLRQRLTSRRYSRTAGNIDIFNPVYGGPVGPRVPAYAWGSTLMQTGIYAQDQMKFGDRWVLVVGGRKDWVSQSETDPFTGAVTIDHQKSNAFSGRAGLVYLAPNGLAPYLSFSQSFEPLTGFDRMRNRFKPMRGEQYELGLRYQPPGQDMLISAAVYQLTMTNDTTTDPVDDNFNVQMGKTRARGFELEARATLGDATSVIAAYSYTDAYTLDGGPLAPELKGKPNPGIPRNLASLWVDHEFDAQGLPGLKIGGGIRYVGPTPARWAAFEVPGYSVVDAMASYEFTDWTLMLNVNNLLDKSYATCTGECFWGEPRRVALTATRRW